MHDGEMHGLGVFLVTPVLDEKAMIAGRKGAPGSAGSPDQEKWRV